MKRIIDMIKNTILLAIVLGISVGATSCGAARKAGKATTLKEKSSEGLLRVLASRKLDAEWFEAKAKLDFSDGSQSVKANATIRMKKGELVWVSIKKLGFEVGRALIRQDSVFIINRLNNEFYAEPLKYIEREYNIPADLAALQNLLLGNPVFFSTSGFQFEENGTHYQLAGKGGGMESRYLINTQGLMLEQMDFEEKESSRRVQYQLAQYAPVAGNRNFSYLRSLEMDSPSTGRMSVGIQFSDVQLDVPKEIKFEIPDKYTRVGAR